MIRSCRSSEERECRIGLLIKLFHEAPNFNSLNGNLLGVFMIKILVKFVIDSDGESPRQLVERLRAVGGVPLVGEYDVEIPMSETDRLFPKLDAIHRALRGSGALYSVSTSSGSVEKADVGASADEQKILDMRKQLYWAKLVRWKEMGVDTSPLEELLETDIEKFKEVSRTYLREHLDQAQVVEDVTENLKKIDQTVYACLDYDGVPLDKICKSCDIDEHEAVLSLARLITAGRATRLTSGDKETYVRIKRTRTLKNPTKPRPAETLDEALERVFESIHHKGSTFQQICRQARLPEGQVLSSLSDLMTSGKLKRVKRGDNTIYLRKKES